MQPLDEGEGICFQFTSNQSRRKNQLKAKKNTAKQIQLAAKRNELKSEKRKSRPQNKPSKFVVSQLCKSF